MGGLINENGTETKTSPSLINKIPLLKTLATHGKTETNSSEMIMLVTPRLVNLDDADEDSEE